MNTRLMTKLIFVLGLLLFMVILGLSNRNPISFQFLDHSMGKIPAALMYFIFLGAGVLLGALLSTGWPSSGKK